MKMNFLKFLMMGATLALVLASCKKEDDLTDPPTITDLSISNDNANLTLTFSAAVYANDNASGALSDNDLIVTIAGGTATLGSYTVTHQAGSPAVTIALTTVGAASGNEVVTVATANNTSVYNAEGRAMDAGVQATVNLNETGIIGKWQSSGDNVALLLRNTGIDSIYAEFKADNTYIVEAFQADGSRTELTGTFGQTKSSTGNIYNLTVTQNTPTALISEGIFEVTASGSNTLMTYEIAQTDPNIPGVTPPTASGGFGSTSGGLFGSSNVQKYIKL